MSDYSGPYQKQEVFDESVMREADFVSRFAETAAELGLDPRVAYGRYKKYDPGKQKRFIDEWEKKRAKKNEENLSMAEIDLSPIEKKKRSVKGLGIFFTIFLIAILVILTVLAIWYLIIAVIAFYYALKYENLRHKSRKIYSRKNVALNSLSGPIFLYRYYKAYGV